MWKQNLLSSLLLNIFRVWCKVMGYRLAKRIHVGCFKSRAIKKREEKEYKDERENISLKCRLWCMWSVFVFFGKLLCQLDRARVCSNSQEIKRKRRRGHLSLCSPWSRELKPSAWNRRIVSPCDWILLSDSESLILHSFVHVSSLASSSIFFLLPSKYIDLAQSNIKCHYPNEFFAIYYI